MNRTTFQQINTLPWGRPAATNPDAEPDWEALRAHADERARLEAQAQGRPVQVSQATQESGEDADDEALWAAARQLASQDEPTSEFVGEADDAWVQSEQTPVAEDWAALQAEQAAWQAAQAQQEWASEGAWDAAQAEQAAQQDAQWAEQEQAAAEQAWQHQQWLAAEQAAAEEAWQAQQLQAAQAALQAQPAADPWAATAPAPWAAPSHAQTTPVDPFAFEPQAVVASPSLLPTGPTAVRWSDESEPIARKSAPSKWLLYTGLAAALGVAAVVGMGVVSSQNEQQARMAAAERTRREMLAEEEARKAAEAARLAQEQAAERARAEAALAAAQAAGTTPSKSTVASLLAAGIHVPTAPIAAKPTGVRTKAAPMRARMAKKGAKRGAAQDDDVHVGGESDARSNDPIFGL